MVKDADFQLYASDAQAATAGAALSTNGTAKILGRVGLHRKAQIYLYVQNADANRDLTFKLELTLNDSQYREVGQATVAAGFKGQVVVNVSAEYPWERWDNDEIKVRGNLSSPSHASAGSWGKVRAGLGYGEAQSYGRADAADTLVDA